MLLTAYYRDKSLRHEYNAQTCTLKDVGLSAADGDHILPPKSDFWVFLCHYFKHYRKQAD